MIKLVISGALGKMGSMVCELAARSPEFEIVAGVDPFGSADTPFALVKDIARVSAKVDVVIDFSRPEALGGVLDYCVANNTAAVIATTGLGPDDVKKIESAGKIIPVFFSANMSLGVNLQLGLCERAASTLGSGFDIEIIEKHHNTKLDAPSGTALMLANGICSQFQSKKHYVYGRHTKTEKRAPNEIGIHAVRGGTIVGEHQVHFIGRDEIIEITHIAHSRQVFASGALTAAEFLVSKGAGVYDMRDVVAQSEAVTHVYANERQSVITLRDIRQGSTAQIFTEIALDDILVDMISQTAPRGGKITLSFSLTDNQVQGALARLEKLGIAGPDVISGLTKLTVLGKGMERLSGVASRLFKVLGEEVKLILITTSETKIAFCVEPSDAAKALEALRREFNLS